MLLNSHIRLGNERFQFPNDSPELQTGEFNREEAENENIQDMNLVQQQEFAGHHQSENEDDDINIIPPTLQISHDQQSYFLQQKQIEGLKKQLEREKKEKKKILSILEKIQFENTQLIEDKENLESQLRKANLLIETFQESMIQQAKTIQKIEKPALQINTQNLDSQKRLNLGSKQDSSKIKQKPLFQQMSNRFSNGEIFSKRSPMSESLQFYRTNDSVKSRIKKEYQIQLYYMHNPSIPKIDNQHCVQKGYSSQL